MKTFLIPIFILLVGTLGFIVYKDTEMKKQEEVNQLLNESNQPKKKSEQISGLPIVAAGASETP